MNFSEAKTPSRCPISGCSLTQLLSELCCSNLSAAVLAQLGPATVSQPAWRAFVLHILSLQVNSKVQTICSMCLSGPGLLSAQAAQGDPSCSAQTTSFCWYSSAHNIPVLLGLTFIVLTVLLVFYETHRVRPKCWREENHWLLQALNQIFPLLKDKQSCREDWI